MNFTLQQFLVYRTVLQTGSLTQTAYQLHLTQPAVSAQLKNFLDHFDEPLIQRTHRQIRVTEKGLDILRHTERILDEIQLLNSKINRISEGLSGKLRISSVSTGKYLAPYFLSGFVKKNKNVDLSLNVTNKTNVVESLANGQADFALVSVLPENLQIEYIELLENKLFLVGSGQEPWTHGNAEPSIFLDLPLIYREEGSGTRYVMERYLRKQKWPFRIQLELTSNEAVKQAVIAGLGYSVMPLIGIKNEIMNGQLRIIPIQGFPIVSTWRLVWMKTKKMATLSKAYLEFLKENKSKIVENEFGWHQQF